MPTTRRSSRRPYQAEHVPLDFGRARGGLAVESRANGTWSVRRVNSEKTYTCPGCNQVIAAGVNHVVAWQNDSWRGDEAALADRRHWHSACWAKGKR